MVPVVRHGLTSLDRARVVLAPVSSVSNPEVAGLALMGLLWSNKSAHDEDYGRTRFTGGRLRKLPSIEPSIAALHSALPFGGGTKSCSRGFVSIEPVILPPFICRHPEGDRPF